MKQGHDEPVHGFEARSRGQASVCKFSQQWPNCEAITLITVEAMIKYVLWRGLEFSEILLNPKLTFLKTLLGFSFPFLSRTILLHFQHNYVVP